MITTVTELSNIVSILKYGFIAVTASILILSVVVYKSNKKNVDNQ